jgi:hypothetical protein
MSQAFNAQLAAQLTGVAGVVLADDLYSANRKAIVTDPSAICIDKRH